MANSNYESLVEPFFYVTRPTKGRGLQKRHNASLEGTED